MSEDNEWKKYARALEKINALVKGNKMYAATTGVNYKIIIKTKSSAACKVVVAQTTAAIKYRPVIRLDAAHRNVPFNHINVNPKVSGVPDPHIKLPPGGLTVTIFFVIDHK